MALTDVRARQAKPADRPYRISDANNLYLYVRPSGKKVWRYDYSLNGRRNTLTLGAYPEVSLKDARRLHSTAFDLLKSNKDPAMERRREAAALKAEAANTFGGIADEYLERLVQQGRTRKTIVKNDWCLNRLAAELRPMPIRQITPADVLRVIKAVEASGRIDTAHRTRAAISAVFRLAVATLRADSDPTYALRGALLPNKSTPQAAITDERRFGALLANIEDYDGWPTLRAALKMMALCYPRPVELRKACWEHFDLKRAEWTIPAEHSKLRREFVIPLSPQAIDIARSVAAFSGRRGLVFPSVRNPDRPLSENAMNSALRRMGYAKTEHTSHGFRSSASTILNARRFPSDVIEASLAHLDPNRVRRTYNRYDYWDERVAMAQQWADICDQLRLTALRRDNSDLV
ncbi:tyrosine-type recombinase/integrase [Pararhizobium haloflavum]|uniref:tyrosine-type recombinase/integrase n=1 Tax=Pararhizobium haloflavum TaxID=2037914 RepID=UPI000C185806|nr:integrase arm-type DNA-binding domain-containing protein [Pararhizobium haloflavum]